MSYRRLAILMVAIVGATAALTYGFNENEADMARTEIEKLVVASYVHGAFNEQNTDAMRDGFHPVFKIHGVADGALREYPIDDWIGAINDRKAKPGYQQENWTHEFPIVDVTGDAAIVKVELFQDGKHVYTDYLSLLKFADGWKITDKVYHRHPES